MLVFQKSLKIQSKSIRQMPYILFLEIYKKIKKEIIALKTPNVKRVIIKSFFNKVFWFSVVIFHSIKLNIPKGKDTNKLM